MVQMKIELANVSSFVILHRKITINRARGADFQVWGLMRTRKRGQTRVGGGGSRGMLP